MSVIPIESESHWKELRARHVGGSEVAALFGVRPFHTTLLELWLIKRGEASAEIEDNDRMFWGRTVEDAIAQGVAKKYGWRIEQHNEYVTCDDTPGMGCTPDRYIFSTHRDTPGLLQIKNVDLLEYMKWEDGEPPLKFQLQLQHELACAGYAWGALAILVGGNDLKVIEYEALPGAVARIKAAVTEFWQSVAMNSMPKATAEDFEVVKEFYNGFTAPVDMTSDNHLPALCAKAKDAAERKKVAEQEEKQAKAEILQKIGTAPLVNCSGFTIKRTQVEKEAYTVKSQSYIMLNIKAEK